MKRAVLASVALLALAAAAAAADLPIKAPPPVVPPQFGWSGFYIGANIGAGWENFKITETFSGLRFESTAANSFVGGGQIGFNYQVSPFFVLGVEGFIDGVASRGNNSAALISPIVGSVTATANSDWVSTLAGRIGFTSPGFDHWLFYAKGGGGWVQTSATITASAVPVTFSGSRTVSGWMAGAGIEWALATNWTARIDFQFIGLESTSLTSGFALDTFSTRNANVQAVTVGVNYLFNWGSPVVARY